MAAGRGRVMSSQVVSYRVDDATTVKLEIEPTEGFRPAGPGETLGRIQEAITPAVEAAKAVLEKVKETRPDGIEVKFGVKASCEASWLVAKAAGEGNFEVTITWCRREEDAVRRTPGRAGREYRELKLSPGAVGGCVGSRNSRFRR
jgi:hypothetical protein